MTDTSAVTPPAARRAPGWGAWGARLTVAAAALAVLGHLVFWYGPRSRPARPDPADLPATLLGVEGAPTRLWLAYPHQNLHAGRSAALDELVRLLGPSLPPFGPFRLPPSRELAVAASADGGVAAARVYPSLAWAARAAGALAANPWLGGGPVQVDGLDGEVEWRGTLWIARWGAAALPEPGSVEAEDARITGTQTALLWLDPAALGLEIPPRAGLWTLEADPSGIRLSRLGANGEAVQRSARQGPPASGGERPQELALFAARRREGRDEALLLLDQAQDPGILRLPSAALAETAEGGESRFSLPAGELQEALGAKLRRERHGPWSIVGTDLRAVELARRALPEIPDAAAAGPPSEGSAGERWEVGLRPAAVHRLARAVDDAFEVLPVGSRRTRARWRRWREWSGALREHPWVVLSLEPDRIEVSLEETPREPG